MSINDTLQEKLSMTRIKIMSIATENLWNAERVDEYLEITSNINPSTMHFSIKHQTHFHATVMWLSIFYYISKSMT